MGKQTVLDNNREIEYFLREELQIPQCDVIKVISNIRDCYNLQKLFQDTNSCGTMNDVNYRILYVDDASRWNLREKIVEELYTLKRLVQDDKINLRKGGALPNTEVKNERRAFIVTGLPASGKSGLSEKIADEVGGILLDSDYAKRKLPEYNDNIGASYVHKESKLIIFGDYLSNMQGQPPSFNILLEKCTASGNNIVIPIIGDTVEGILELQMLCAAWEYSVNFIHLSINKYEATKRAVYRFKSSKRYVPLDKMLDIYAENNPTLAYYKIRVHFDSLFESFCLLSADNVPIGQSLIVQDEKNASYITNIFK